MTHDPPRTRRPTRASLQGFIDELLEIESVKHKEDTCYGTIQSASNWIKAMCYRRSMIRTKTGLFGIAPESARTGEIVVVLFGCSNPLVLRPVHGSIEEYPVVGQCHIDSIMNGEAILGRLPDQFECVRKDFGSRYRWAFRNNETGEISGEDPRHGLIMGENWRQYPKWANYVGDQDSLQTAFNMECMRIREVELREFRII